jgi:hypothetical protein
MRPRACSEKRDIDVFGLDQASTISISGLCDTFGINHLLTSNTATAQQNVMAKAELRIRVRMIGFLHLCPAFGILDVR